LSGFGRVSDVSARKALWPCIRMWIDRYIERGECDHRANFTLTRDGATRAVSLSVNTAFNTQHSEVIMTEEESLSGFREIVLHDVKRRVREFVWRHCPSEAQRAIAKGRRMEWARRIRNENNNRPLKRSGAVAKRAA
jgi:hypothetical protein